MAYFKMGGEGSGPPEEAMQRWQEMFGPGQVEIELRQAISMCWMALPAAKKNLDDLEREIRRILDRIFQNLREDESSFAS